MDNDEIKSVVEEAISDALEYVESTEYDELGDMNVEDATSEAMGYLEEYGFFEDFTVGQLQEAMYNAMINHWFNAADVTQAVTALVEWLEEQGISLVED